MKVQADIPAIALGVAPFAAMADRAVPTTRIDEKGSGAPVDCFLSLFCD